LFAQVFLLVDNSTMSSFGTNKNFGKGVKTFSLLASIALHAAVLASASLLIGDTGTGPAKSSSTLHVSVERADPADDIPMDNPDLSRLEQQPEQPKPFQDSLKAQSASTNSSAKHEADKHISISLNQPASDKKGADVTERQPMQVATSGSYSSQSRDYKSKLIRLVERYKYYPLKARSNGIEGTSTVEFTVRSNGNISGVSLARSSGIKILDQAALQTIKRIGRAPPLPNSRKRWKFNIPMTFDLK
jgi:protein TonB